MPNPHGLPDWWFKHQDDSDSAQSSGPGTGYVVIAQQVFVPGMVKGQVAQ